MPDYESERYRVKFSYPEYLKLVEIDDVIELLSSHSSDDDPYKDRIKIAVFNSSNNLTYEMNAFLDSLNETPTVEGFDSTVVDDPSNRAIGIGKEATFSFTGYNYDIKGKAFIAKKANVFLVITLYAHPNEYNNYLSSYDSIKRSLDFSLKFY